MRAIRCAAAALVIGQACAALAEDRPWTLRSAVGAPEALKLSGSARVRYETLSGQYRAGLDPSDRLLTLRTSLFAEYDLGRVAIGSELSDSRAYLGDRGSAVSANEVNALELVQAYLAFDAGDARLTLGRMAFDLGSRRLVADETFRNTHNGFTGARLDWRTGRAGRLTLVYTLPQVRLPDDKASILDNEVVVDRESFDLRLWGGVFGMARAGRLSFDVYAIGLDERDSARRATRNRHLVTPGVRLYREPARDAFDYEVEAAWQTGRIRATAAPADRDDRDVAAWFVHAEVGRSIDAAWQPRVAVEYEIASGDRAGTRRFERFDTLYGSRRNDFGPGSIYGLLGRANVSSPALRLEVAPDARTDGWLVWRPLWLEGKRDAFSTSGVRDPSGRSGRFAGNQIEARARYWLVPRLLRAEAGGALLLRGRFFKDAPNATRNGDTAYFYTDLTATF